jgi:hypothetical protein
MDTATIAPPPGFVLDSPSDPPPPQGFVLDTPPATQPAAKVPPKTTGIRPSPPRLPAQPRQVNPRPLAGRIAADVASRVIGDPNGMGVAGMTAAFANPSTAVLRGIGMPDQSLLKVTVPPSTPMGEGIGEFVKQTVEGLSNPYGLAQLALPHKMMAEMLVNAPEDAAKFGKALGEGDTKGATKALLNYVMDVSPTALARGVEIPKEVKQTIGEAAPILPRAAAQTASVFVPRVIKPKPVVPESGTAAIVPGVTELLAKYPDPTKPVTIRQVQELWPEAKLNNEQARVWRDAANAAKTKAAKVVPAATTAQVSGKEPPIEKGPLNAREIVPSATLHGDVRPQPIEVEREVPAAQGSGGILTRPVEPVQPQAKPPQAPATAPGQPRVLLKPATPAPPPAAGMPEKAPKGPGLEGGFGPANPEEFSEAPSKSQTLWNKATAPFKKAVATARVVAQTKGVKAAMARLKDAGDNTARVFALQQSNDVRNPIRRAFGKDSKLAEEALSFYVEAGGAEDLPADQLSANLSAAIDKMRLSKAAGKKWRDRGIDAAQFALYHMDEFKAAAKRYSEITDAQVGRENSRGVDTLKYPRYVMHLQDLADESFGAFEKSGGQGEASSFRKTRTHPTFADSIAAGIDPVTLNGVDLLQRRLANGERLANSRAWIETFRHYNDPKTNQPIFQNFKMEKRADGTSYPVAPEGYTLEHLGSQTVAVQKGYEGVATALTDPSLWMRNGAGRFLMQANAFGKSGRLMIDTFHAGRIAMWQAAIKAASLKPANPLPSYRKGQILLDYTESEIRKMAEAGEIPKEWVQPILDAKPAHNLMLKTGFNIGRISDNLHQEWVRSVPLAGRFNRWVFDQFQRGVMSELWQLEYKRLKSARPNMSAEAAASQISKDLNTRMGNLGRQGWFKSRTMQDTARLLALAPGWNEGLIMSELGAVRQLGSAVKAAGQGQRLYAGTLLRSVGGMSAMIFVANQAINYATRGHPTWDNPEEGIGAKLSAWIPDPFGGPGFFLNPLSLPAETAALLLRRYEKDQNALDPLNDYIRSRMSYAAAPVAVELQRRDQIGRPIREEDVPKEMARSILPFPIGFDTYLRALTSEGKDQHYAGEFVSQMVSRGGLKLDQAPSPSQRISALAKQFDAAKGIKPSAEFYTGDYEALTHALSLGNMDEAKKQLQILQGKKTKAQIQKHFQQWPSHPLTGSRAREAEFKRSLSAEQLSQYQQAIADKKEIARKFRSLRPADQ